MSTHRDPLGSISLNTTTNASASSSRRIYVPPKDRPLASIFIQKRRQPSTPSSSSYASASSPPDIKTPAQSSQDVEEADQEPLRKRARVDAWDDDLEDVEERKREDELTGYFMPTTPTLGSRRVWVEKEKEEVVPVVEERAANTWVRSRRRLGVTGFRDTVITLDRLTPTYFTHPPYLSTLTHSLTPFLPEAIPSKILLPSLHSPTGRARDLSPALCVQFSNTARRHTATSAKEMGLRRMLAVAGEEGGMRIIDVDAPQGHHRESGGWWWRAHANAIFDTKWTDDDSRIMTTSGDQTTRIHALDNSFPTLLATLRGHTSSVKTATFFDPSRANQGTDATKGSIVASGGRDGNILIFDLRCQGRKLGEGGEEYGARSTARERDRYSAGIPGFSPKREGEALDPVMVINGAHKEIGKRGGANSSIKSVTALLALQTMPGKLASGGSADGIVRLWDLRFPAPTNRFPDPHPVHSPALFLPDPTTFGHPASRRPRGIHSIIESPLSGDIYTLTGDSKIHTIRPSYASPQSGITDPSFHQGILPESYSSENLAAQSFFVKIALTPDGRYLAAGSGKGGVVAFDTREKGSKGVQYGLGESVGYWPEDRTREVSSVDWGMGTMAACSDDRVTRIWRCNEGEKKDEWGSIGGV